MNISINMLKVLMGLSYLFYLFENLKNKPHNLVAVIMTRLHSFVSSIIINFTS
jgi:hypothetical protein